MPDHPTRHTAAVGGPADYPNTGHDTVNPAGPTAAADPATATAASARERRPRRVPLVITAAVGLLLLGGVAFAWLLDRRAVEWKAARDRTADAVAGLLVQCEDALRADDAPAAARALDAAEKRAAEGGTDHLADRVARCRADLALLRDLNRANDRRWARVEGRPTDRDQAAGAWPGVFKQYGVVPGVTSADEAAQRVNGSPVREPVLTALDLWLTASQSESLVAVLRAADPDAFRGAVRAAVAAGNDDRLRELAGRPEALGQPPWFAAVLGDLPALPEDRREQILRDAVRRSPRDFAVLMTLGGLRPAPPTGGAAGVEGWYRAALAVRPESVVAWNNLGVALRARGDPDEAVAAYTEAVRLDPTNATVRNNLGVALRARGDATGAVAAFREAIRLDPKFPAAHYNLGNALRGRKNLTGAIAAYKQAIWLDPKYASAHNNLGLALHDQGDHDGAAAAFREAIRLDPKYASARNNLGLVLHDKGDHDGAIAAWRAAIAADPTFARAHYNLGAALSAREDLDGAIAAYREAARLDPNDARIHNDLGLVLRSRGDVTGAIAAWRAAVAADPTFVPAYNNLGIALATRGDLTGAIAAFREALQLDPKNSTARKNLDFALRLKAEQDAEEGRVAPPREVKR